MERSRGWQEKELKVLYAVIQKQQPNVLNNSGGTEKIDHVRPSSGTFGGSQQAYLGEPQVVADPAPSAQAKVYFPAVLLLPCVLGIYV